MLQQPPLIHRILANEPTFPGTLAAISQAPKALWYRGRLPERSEPMLAIVGARAATLAGCRRAQALAAAAVGRGYAIVSGGALGIDAAAHRGALDAEGSTFALLGCGVDVVYPERHTALFEEIAVTGGLISEFPPGTPPRGKQFPSRNRLVAGLASAVLVVEARNASGALITARLGLALGRPLLAVPGSAGTDQLIANGKARAVDSEAELLRALAGEPPARRPPPQRFVPLLAVLVEGGIGPGVIARRLDRSLPDTLALLAEAEMEGWIRRGPGGTFTRREDVEEVSRAS